MYGNVKGGKVDAVAVDLADVEILAYLVDMYGWDAVGGTPDLRRGRGVLRMARRVSAGLCDAPTAQV